MMKPSRPVVFPHANRYTIDIVDFVAMWVAVFEQYGPRGADPLTSWMPRRPSRESLEALSTKNHQFGLEYLCRLMVPSPYRGTGQATHEFLNLNRNYLQSSKQVNEATGRATDHVQLSESARDAWQSAPNQTVAKSDAEALFDLEGNDDAGLRQPGPGQQLSLESIIDLFIGAVDAEPYQPYYRRKKHGAVARGWEARLNAYFWPRPADTVEVNDERLTPIIAGLTALARTTMANHEWSRAEQDEAVSLAARVFKWGGVPQDPRTVNWRNVRAVMESAITGRQVRGAPMNSGWTKVAAFASAHLEKAGRAQAIWDSRVSTSIVRRLDAILKKAGCREIPPLLAGIGLVQGRGGTRPVRNLHFSWPNGYGSWTAQYAGSSFVRQVRDGLNRRRKEESDRIWTTRDVEMVLFGDGY